MEIQNAPEWSEAWFKPSKRILLRHLSFNLRLVFGMAFLLFNYLDEFIFAAEEENLIDFLVSFSSSTNVFVIGLSIGLILLFAYIVLLLTSNVGSVIYAALLYVTFENQVTTDYITIKRGIIFKQKIEIPMQRLTDSQIKINLLDRLLGTADVECNTASRSADINYHKIKTLHQNDAYRLQAFLRLQIQRMSGSLDNSSKKNSSIARIFADPRIKQELKEIHRLVVEIKSKDVL